MNEVNIVSPVEESTISTLSLQQLQEFNKKLMGEPPAIDKLVIGKNKNGGDKTADYVPIGTVEDTLDELFDGLWKTTDFRWQVIGNEVVGSIQLHVFSMYVGTWLTRSGSAATMIRQHQGAKPTEIDKKYSNALVADFPKLESACIKSAAKKFGRIFGRDLNRNNKGVDIERDKGPKMKPDETFEDRLRQQKAERMAKSWQDYYANVLEGSSTVDIDVLRNYRSIFESAGLTSYQQEVAKLIKQYEEKA